MPHIQANGLQLYYESHGPQDGEAILLIMGLGAQLTRWPMSVVEALTGRGYQVIRYDNRDVGLSHRFEEAGAPDIPAILAARAAGAPSPAAYVVEDMAADAAGLLEALEIERAHIVGASMGGMIAQELAARYPDKALSLVSIMSTTGRSDCSRPTMRATAVLLRHPRSDDLGAIVAHGTLAANVVGGRFPMEDAFLAERIRSETLRNRHPAGFVRQMAAIIADGDRSQRLARITAPTLVIHGSDDPLVPVAGGRETARAIPGARLLEIDGMGHTLPPQILPRIVEAIDEHIGSAASGRAMARAA